MNKTNHLEILIAVHLFTQPHLNPTMVGAGTGASGTACWTIMATGSYAIRWSLLALIRIFEVIFFFAGPKGKCTKNEQKQARLKVWFHNLSGLIIYISTLLHHRGKSMHQNPRLCCKYYHCIRPLCDSPNSWSKAWLPGNRHHLFRVVYGSLNRLEIVSLWKPKGAFASGLFYSGITI